MKKIPTTRILLVEDEQYDIRRVESTLAPFAEHLQIVDVVSDGQSALDRIRAGGNYDVVIMDFQISGGLRGESLIRRMKELDETLQIIVITKMTMNVSDFEFANQLLEAGAIWFCTKYPGDIEKYIYQPTDFVLNIINAFERRKLHQERLLTNRRLDAKIAASLEDKKLIGHSKGIQTVREQISRCAAASVNIIVAGESGTGKELVATHIHLHSDRKYGNFVPVNCASLPDHLIESELFGFEKGAFTGASAEKKGLFEVANGGTIFLDEITELPLPMQSKLLRVIQEKEIDKIGRTAKVEVDVRVIAATNRNLHEEVKAGRFRQDLYYRLNVVSVTVPPLVDRREDVLPLFAYFLSKYGREMSRPEPVLEAEANEVFAGHAWPGNVRELQNVVQRLLLSGAVTVDAEAARHALGHLPGASAEAAIEDRPPWSTGKIIPWRDMELQLQAGYFRFVRERCKSDAEAARMLGLAPPNYHRMCKRLGLK